MKKIVILFLANSIMVFTLLLGGCNSTDKERKELAKAEEEALEKADEANKLVPQEAGKEEIEGVKKDLEKANEKLSEKQEKYLSSLKDKESKLNDRIKKTSEKLKSSEGSAKAKVVEKHDKLVKERDQLQANIMEIQSPMTDEKFETVQKEINLLINVIDKELAAE